MNLLEETKDDIRRSGHSIADVVYIGNRDGYSCTWAEFEVIADVEYNNGFGSSEVATDLLVVFSDKNYLQRAEYDGSEWWQYNPPITIPNKLRPVKRLIGNYWPTLAHLQGEPDGHYIPFQQQDQ